MADRSLHMTMDDVYPRDAEHRYRLYAKFGNELKVLAAAPDAGGLGEMIIALHEDEKAQGREGISAHGRIGVLDVLGGKNAGTGEWIIPLWDRSIV